MCRHITAEEQREGWRAVVQMIRGLTPIIRSLVMARRAQPSTQTPRRKTEIKAVG